LVLHVEQCIAGRLLLLLLLLLLLRLLGCNRGITDDQGLLVLHRIIAVHG
jgi:hypothetical protein